jgi:hypothetical protein
MPALNASEIRPIISRCFPIDQLAAEARVGKLDCEGTFAGTHGNAEVAPIPGIEPQLLERWFDRCRRSVMPAKSTMPEDAPRFVQAAIRTDLGAIFVSLEPVLL